MTKTYDLVTLYYKGHSPLKKQDNSYLLCLYTMLFVLFAMVTVLLVCTFYNVEPVKTAQIYVHNQPEQQKKSDVPTTRPNTTPKAPHVDPDYYNEDTPKPVINWDNIVDFFVGSEEDTAPNHPVRDASERTPTSSVWNQSNVTESRMNQSANVIRSSKGEKPDQVPLVASPMQEHTTQESAFDVKYSRDATESKQKPRAPPEIGETGSRGPIFVIEDVHRSTEARKVPDTTKGSQLDVEHFTKAPIPKKVPENTNKELEFDINQSPNITKAPTNVTSAQEDIHKESKSISEDANDTTQGSTYPKTPPIEEDFNEWSETVRGGATTTQPTEGNLNTEVEWVPAVQNLNSRKKAGHFKVQKDCTSARCELAASSMISSINLSVEPCDNFYNFACGGVASRKEKMEPELIPDNSISDSNFVKKFNLLYKSCLQHENYFDYRDRISRTRRVLNDLGMLNFDLDQRNTDLTDVVATLVLLDAMPLFNIDIDVINSTFTLKFIPPDRTLSSKYWSPLAETKKNCLRTTQPENYHSTIDITFLYYDYQRCLENNKDYLKSLATAIEELGNFGKLNNTERKQHIREVVEFTQNNLLPLMDQTLGLQKKNSNQENVEMNIKDLTEQFPIIDWYKFFKVISANDKNITSSLQVYHRAYFEVLFKKLSSFDKEIMFKSLSAILTEKYYQEIVLPTPKHSRAKYCSKLSRKLLPEIWNYLYQSVEVSEDFEARKNYLQSLFHDMKQDFQDSLQSSEWLDESSRTSMRNRISNLELEMSEDSSVKESIYLEELYSKLDLKEGDFSMNFYKAAKFRKKTFLSLQGKYVETEDIFRNFVQQSREEPVFFYGHNIVCIPDGLVHKTFLDFPKYLIVAKIGFPLAKVIGHALDPIGLQFGVNLSENVSSMYDKFLRETKRSLPHHLTFNKLNLVFNLNNQLSAAERIAENSAMALVTKMIEEVQTQPLLPWVSFTFSREKIFFIALVQEFCSDLSLMEFVVQAHENAVLPTQFVVQNILQNSDAFHDQFSCRPPAKINQLQFPYLSFLVPKDNDKIT